MNRFLHVLYKNNNLLYKVFLFLATTIFVVYLFPKSGTFRYSFENGKPWQSENLYAPFDFAIQKSNEELKEEQQCDLIICLSHLGYYYKRHPETVSDLNLAKATKDIDLIIGGHTHTFLPKPTIVKNVADKNMLVNQVGCYGLYLGRVDFYFDEFNQKTSKETTILVG